MDEKVRWLRYYRTTTVSQRKMLFEVLQETGNVSEACRRARVSRATYYYWKDRFDKGGYVAVEEPRSHAPLHPSRKTSPEVANRVVAMKTAHPEWGRQRIADELMKENGWQRMVSASTVRRILVSKEPKACVVTEKSEKSKGVVLHSEKPGQTIHVDLCFVPATHEAIEDLPAVSGSSGKLKVCKPKESEGKWPGQVFAEPGISYEQAMDTYVNARSEPAPLEIGEEEADEVKRRDVLRQEETLRIDRRNVRERRKQEDEAWRQIRKQRKEERKARRQQKQEERRAQRNRRRRAEEELWKEQRRLRREQMKARKEGDRAWREQRNRIREHKESLPVVTLWIAILVIVDNCTRRCFGLPMFTAGSHVTAQMVVSALELLLPPELQYLIADRGVHFGKLLESLAQNRGFTRVFLAPHRPQSNGIAERFVRTLKEWLLDKPWDTPEEFIALLSRFLLEYNDRPHQGRELKGLSPNELERRLLAAV